MSACSSSLFPAPGMPASSRRRPSVRPASTSKTPSAVTPIGARRSSPLASQRCATVAPVGSGMSRSSSSDTRAGIAPGPPSAPRVVARGRAGAPPPRRRPRAIPSALTSSTSVPAATSTTRSMVAVVRQLHDMRAGPGQRRARRDPGRSPSHPPPRRPGRAARAPAAARRRRRRAPAGRRRRSPRTARGRPRCPRRRRRAARAAATPPTPSPPRPRRGRSRPRARRGCAGRPPGSRAGARARPPRSSGPARPRTPPPSATVTGTAGRRASGCRAFSASPRRSWAPPGASSARAVASTSAVPTRSSRKSGSRGRRSHRRGSSVVAQRRRVATSGLAARRSSVSARRAARRCSPSSATSRRKSTTSPSCRREPLRRPSTCENSAIAGVSSAKDSKAGLPVIAAIDPPMASGTKAAPRGSRGESPSPGTAGAGGIWAGCGRATRGGRLNATRPPVAPGPEERSPARAGSIPSSVRPASSAWPGANARSSSMRAPSRYVPLLEPRSATVTPLVPTRRTRWRRDIERSGRVRSAPGPRPTTCSPAREREAPPGVGAARDDELDDRGARRRDLRAGLASGAQRQPVAVTQVGIQQRSVRRQPRAGALVVGRLGLGRRHPDVAGQCPEQLGRGRLAPRPRS